MTQTGFGFRGWWVLAGLFLLYCASNGIFMHSLPLIYPKLMEDFGWTEVQVTLPATVFYVVSAVTSPPAGVLLDRYSSRHIMLAGAVGLVISLVCLSQVDALWQMVGVYVLIGTALSLTGLVSNVLVVSRWFDRYRGRAIGILLMASSLGGVVFPQFMGVTLESQGWRMTLLMLAAIAAVMMILPLLFLVRNSPAEYELLPDGAPTRTGVAPTALAGTGPTLAQALRQKNFYLLALATAAVFFSVIALTQHQSIHLGRDLGVPGPMLATVFSVFFGASVVGKLMFGFLGDHFRRDRVMMVSIGVLLAGLLLLRMQDGQSQAGLMLYALVAGVGFSGAFTSIQVLVAGYFAGPSFGKILAVIILFDTLAGALGTRVIGGLREATGSYLAAIDLMMGVCALAILALVLLRFSSGPSDSRHGHEEMQR